MAKCHVNIVNYDKGNQGEKPPLTGSFPTAALCTLLAVPGSSPPTPEHPRHRQRNSRVKKANECRETKTP
jgi:hypothetical protein